MGINRSQAVLVSVLVLLVAGIAAFGIFAEDRGSFFTKSDSQASDIKYVVAAGANVSALDSLRYKTSAVTMSDGNLVLQLDMDITENRSEQGYGVARVKGPKGEVPYEFAMSGANVFLKFDGGRWEKKTFADLGIDRKAATQSFDFATAPGSKVENLPNVTENGLLLKHVRVVFDPAVLTQRTKEVYTSGQMRSAIDVTTIERAAGEYFIRVSDGLPVRTMVSMEISTMGQKATSITRVEYVDYGAQVKLPSDLPK